MLSHNCRLILDNVLQVNGARASVSGSPVLTHVILQVVHGFGKVRFRVILSVVFFVPYLHVFVGKGNARSLLAVNQPLYDDIYILYPRFAVLLMLFVKLM